MFQVLSFKAYDQNKSQCSHQFSPNQTAAPKLPIGPTWSTAPTMTAVGSPSTRPRHAGIQSGGRRTALGSRLLCEG